MNNVLIVDDEVEGATPFVVFWRPGERVIDNPTVTFIAEDGGFNATNIPDQWKLDFQPSKQREKTVFNAISYILPAEFADPVRDALTGIVPWLNAKHVMLTLLNLPIKVMSDNQPSFTFRYRD